MLLIDLGGKKIPISDVFILHVLRKVFIARSILTVEKEYKDKSDDLSTISKFNYIEIILLY